MELMQYSLQTGYRQVKRQWLWVDVHARAYFGNINIYSEHPYKPQLISKYLCLLYPRLCTQVDKVSYRYLKLTVVDRVSCRGIELPHHRCSCQGTNT